VYKFSDNGMASKQTDIGKIVATGAIVLLMCVIVLVQVPELVSLNEDTTNDFLIHRANAADLLVLPDPSKYLRIADIQSESPAAESVFSCLTQFEIAALVPSELSILYSVIRT
jgi:hypothetical protein